MFKQQKGKNAFLLKKTQEKQKVQEQQKLKLLSSKIQKNVRAFLDKRKAIKIALAERNFKLHLLMNIKLTEFSAEETSTFVQQISKGTPDAKKYYLSRFVLNHIETQKLPDCIFVLSNPQNEAIRQSVFSSLQYLHSLKTILQKRQGATLLNLSASILQVNGLLERIQSQLLLKTLLDQFSQSYVQIQGPFESHVNDETIGIVLKSISSRKEKLEKVDLNDFAHLVLYFIKMVSKQSTQDQKFSSGSENIICFCLTEFMRLGALRHEEITKNLVKENQNLIALIEDDDLLEELENKLRSSEELEDFTNQFLKLMKSLMVNPCVLSMFEDNRHKYINQTLLGIVNELSVLFEDRRLIFVRDLISSDVILRTLCASQDSMFFEGLKMRLLGMDDQQFRQFNVFTNWEWQKIIDNCILTADIKIQKLIERSNNQQNFKQLIPFKKRISDELQLKTVVDLLINLYKKILRTNKFSSEIFVNYNVSSSLQNFLFGKGAKRIEMLLKQVPFIFSFESRMKKLKEFIKLDKLNYDRTLFLQEQVDEDLIIAVRRGNEFQDAYDAGMNRDLRKKYKIIFFNQQGLEEEGVDGGGIIKEFINRVLKASFSEQYGLFMETPLNEIIPNPYSISTAEYEFVGKIVGKAVYQGINIDQKFAEPFLNLVIGRQNTFEDLQYIDPDIYKGLLNLKHSQDDISELEQTFVIYDKLPNGKAKYVDLLCPSKASHHKQVLVTNQNKMQFIMSYADFKCNKQIEQKTRLFRKGFLKVMKPEWLTMFSNQELNSIISGDNPDFDVEELKLNTVYNDYHQKDETILIFWQVLKEMTCEQKSLFLLYVTSCSRPPTLGFAAMKPKMCINRDNDIQHLPTANTCMNVLRLPNYKSKAVLRSKLLYAISAKAGFQFA